MENILLVKIQTNVNQRKHMHNTFCQKLLMELKLRSLTVKIGVNVPLWPGIQFGNTILFLLLLTATQFAQLDKH